MNATKNVTFRDNMSFYRAHIWEIIALTMVSSWILFLFTELPLSFPVFITAAAIATTASASVFFNGKREKQRW